VVYRVILLGSSRSGVPGVARVGQALIDSKI
jgi:hypothetical protein